MYVLIPKSITFGMIVIDDSSSNILTASQCDTLADIFMNKPRGTKYKLKYGSIILLCLSLTQECYCTSSGCSHSLMTFLLGWAGLFKGGASVTWLANVFLILSWILIEKRTKIAMFSSVVAFLLAFSFVLFDEVLTGESGHYHKIVSYKSGYWLWLGSSFLMLVLSFSAVYRLNVEKRTQTSA